VNIFNAELGTQAIHTALSRCHQANKRKGLTSNFSKCIYADFRSYES